MQPENPAQLGGKIYEMMNVALSGKWETFAAESEQQATSSSHAPETLEAEVVEPPAEAGSQK